jgi:hypothetical protein
VIGFEVDVVAVLKVTNEITDGSFTSLWTL